MAKISRVQRKNAWVRDSGRCGIHLGGCGRRIERSNQCEVDHIIPLVLAKLIAPAPREFDRPWNYQPMHKECNREKADRMNGRELGELETAATVGANTPDDWPRFQCKCHYLQILGNDLYVCTQTPAGTGKHKLYAGVVMDFGNQNRQDGILVAEQWTGPGGAQVRGFNRTGKNLRGYIFPKLKPR